MAYLSVEILQVRSEWKDILKLMKVKKKKKNKKKNYKEDYSSQQGSHSDLTEKSKALKLSKR